MSRRLLGVLLLVASAVTAVVGTFLPLYWEGTVFGDREDASIGFSTTSWRVTTDSEQMDIDLLLGQSTQFGVPIVIAAVLLVLAAALVFLPEHQRLAARYTAIGAAGLLVGAVWSTGMVVASAVSDEDESELRTYTEHVREGTWVLIVAALIAVVGVVLIHSRRVAPADRPVVYRVDDGDQVAGDDTDTPPYGIPQVIVAQLPETGDRR